VISDILASLRDIANLSVDEDVRAVTSYMQTIRDAGVSPGKVSERGLDFADELMFNQYPERQKIIRMQLSAYIMSKSAKQVGVHAETRRAERSSKE